VCSTDLGGKTKGKIIKEKDLLSFNKFIFIFILNKITEYINLLLDKKSDEYMNAKSECDKIDNTDITIENNIIVLSRFVFDIIINTYDKLYDSNWIHIDKETYQNKIDEHNAREKQENLDRLDNMSDDARRLNTVQNKIKGGLMYKESEKRNLSRVMTGEYESKTMEERMETLKEQFDDSNNQIVETDNTVVPVDDLPGEDEDNGYYDENDFAADGEENEDDLDALQLDTD